MRLGQKGNELLEKDQQGPATAREASKRCIVIVIEVCLRGGISKEYGHASYKRNREACDKLKYRWKKNLKKENK